MRNLTSAPIRRLLVALACGGLLLAACGDDDTSDSDGASAPTSAEGGDTGAGDDAAEGPVTIVEFAYDPITVSAAAGAEVEFTNEDGTAHTATASDNSFDSGSIAAGEAGSVTAPDAAGEYPFFCAFHPFMKGTLVVE